MKSFKNIFSSGGENQEQTEETAIVDELWKNSTLSWSTRIQGFIIMFVLGFIMSFLSTIIFWIGGSLIIFAILYTLGNVCSIGSTMFLMGPVSQVKKMFAATRLIATIIMLVSLVLTLVSALVLKNPPLCLIFVIIQFFALLWYSISYIPFARDAVKKIFSAVIEV